MVRDADRGVVIGQRFDVSCESQVGGAADDLPVLVAIYRAGNEEVAASVHIVQQRSPCLLTQRLRGGKDGEFGRA